MPASIPPGKRQQILALRRQDLRMKEIAERVGVSYSTVRRHCAELDEELAVERSPAATLTEEEVARLRFLAAKMVKQVRCRVPECQEVYFDVRLSEGFGCPFCKMRKLRPAEKRW